MKPLIDTIPTDGEPDIITAIIDKSPRGGKRINAGRKPSGITTVVISFRVNKNHAKDLKSIIQKIIQDYSTT